MTYNVKRVSCYVTSTENGSILSKDLNLMLKWVNCHEVFNQIDGVDPMLIVDENRSRMMGPFLKYVNCHEHLWIAMIDIPYGTHLWQVRDSEQINGAFKIAKMKWKRWLKQQKSDFGSKKQSTSMTSYCYLPWPGKKA
jgi:hypothetical protein